jgi:hypothetical protein
LGVSVGASRISVDATCNDRPASIYP